MRGRKKHRTDDEEHNELAPINTPQHDPNDMHSSKFTAPTDKPSKISSFPKKIGDCSEDTYCSDDDNSEIAIALAFLNGDKESCPIVPERSSQSSESHAMAHRIILRLVLIMIGFNSGLIAMRLINSTRLEDVSIGDFDGNNRKPGNETIISMTNHPSLSLPNYTPTRPTFSNFPSKLSSNASSADMKLKLNRNAAITAAVEVVTLQKIFLDSETPQHKAYDFLLNHDPSNLDLANTDRIIQRYATATAIFSFIGSDERNAFENVGEGFNRHEWINEMHECTWKGINCKHGTDIFAPRNNDEHTTEFLLFRSNSVDHRKRLRKRNKKSNIKTDILPSYKSTNHAAVEELVVEINASHCKLTGTLPVEIEALTYLEILSLDGNEMVGSIPSFLGKLTLLEILNCNNNAFSGPLPSELAKLTNLKHLDLSNNIHLSGAVPDLFCDTIEQSKLTMRNSKIKCSCCEVNSV